MPACGRRINQMEKGCTTEVAAAFFHLFGGAAPDLILYRTNAA